jgi:L-alanine-DL-glutamate epimerase-like enolase superfamily enzyme
VKEYVDAVTGYRESGFTACKLHVPCIPSEDMEICRAVRKAVGEDMLLMLDPVGCYDREQALIVGRELEELNFSWYEEPISDSDMYGLIQLCKSLDIPIATLEVLPGTLYTKAQYIAREAVDIVRSDVMYNGGLTPLKKTASLCEAFGLKCEIHANSNPLMNAANLHVICSIKNCDFYEIIMAEELMEFGVKDGIEIDNAGYAHVPKGPGLGLEVDWKYIDAHTIATF